MKFEGIVLDWAGTTVDFGSMAPVQVFKAIFEKKGIHVTDEEVRRPMGMLKWDHIKTMLAMPRIRGLWMERFGYAPEDSDVNQLYSSFEPMLLKVLQKGTELKPYVIETIEALRKMGYQLGSTTGFNDAMMRPVVHSATEQGYAPDFWITPDAVDGRGRPYPYMIFRNMEYFGWKETAKILKVGDTVSDILEGKAAGAKTAGIVVGSSVMGLTEEEYDALTEEEKRSAYEQAKTVYEKAGADYIFQDIRDILQAAE